MTLIHMPIAMAQEDAPPPANDTGKIQTTVKIENSDADPNYCYEDPNHSSKKKSCESDGLQYNCHLQVCASADDNSLYNKEYKDCNSRPADQRQACRENLKSIAQDMFDAQKLADDQAKEDGGYNGMATTAIAAGGGCAMYFINDCVTDIGAGLAAVVLLAVAFMAMQSNQYEDQFKAAADMLKQQDQANEKGWNVDTQRAAFTSQIEAYKMIKKAAEDKADHHNMIAVLAAIIGVIAGILSIPPMLAANPCAPYTVAGSLVVVLLETNAASHAKGVASDAGNAVDKIEKILKKLDGLYKMRNGSNTVANTDTPTKINPVFNNGTINELGGTSTKLDTEVSNSQQCVSSNSKVGPCPCEGGSCYDFDFSVPNNNIGTQAGKLLNFSSFESAADNAAKGKTQELKSLSTAGNSALARKLQNRVAKYALKKAGDKFNDKTKNLINALLSPNKKGSSGVIGRHLASRFSPLKAAALTNRYGLSKFERADDEGKEKLAKNTSAVPSYKGSSLNLAALNKKLKGIDDFNLDDLEDNSFYGQKDENIAENNLEKGGIEPGADLNEVHPDAKISIFKIISNRYNVIRIQKRLR